MKIMLINDDHTLTSGIKQCFKTLHHCQLTHYLHTRDIGDFKQARFSTYNAILMNASLPYENGISLCKKIRLISDVPILIITDIEKLSQSKSFWQNLNIKGDEFSVTNLNVAALQAGADDIVSSDIAMSELFARVKNIVGRAKKKGSVDPLTNMDVHYTFSFIPDEELYFDMAKMHLSSNYGLNITLTTSDAELLCIFLQNPRKMLTRDFLIQRIKMRNYSGLTDRFIDVRVGMLRKKLLDYQHKFIRTIRGKGYFFDAKVVIS